MKIHHLLVILIVLSACSGEKKSKSISSASSAHEVQEVPRLNEIIDNDLANTPLGSFNFRTKKLESLFKGSYLVEKSAVKNRYTDEIDTLIYFRKANSFVQFYKTKNKVMLFSKCNEWEFYKTES